MTWTIVSTLGVIGGGLIFVMNSLRRQFDKIDARFDKIDARFDRIDERFIKIETQLNRIEVNHGERLSRIEGTLYRFYYPDMRTGTKE